jgi:antitoxin CptB
MDMPLDAATGMPSAVDAPTLRRLRWRCRRGLLENDLLIERFFARQAAGLTQAQARGMQALMDLPDNDLLDLLLARSEPTGELARPDVLEVLGLMRAPRAFADRGPLMNSRCANSTTNPRKPHETV